MGTAQLLKTVFESRNKEDQDRLLVSAMSSIDCPDMNQAWAVWEKLKTERAEAIEREGGGSWAEDWWDPTDLSLRTDMYEQEGSRDKGVERNKMKGLEGGEEIEQKCSKESEQAEYRREREGFMGIDDEVNEELNSWVETSSMWRNGDWAPSEPVTP